MKRVPVTHIGRQGREVEESGDGKGARRRSCATGWSEGSSSSNSSNSSSWSSRSSDNNNRERGLADISEVAWVQAVFEMEDTQIKENGGNAMVFVKLLA